MVSPASALDEELLSKLKRILREQGVHAVLKVLNSRTPHRFTAIYRYDPPTLRNVLLVDAFDPELRTGGDVAMADAYCVMVGRERRSIVFDDAACDPRFAQLPNSPVVCYCGVLLSTSDGVPFGTLCHYDVARCDVNTNDVTVLEAIAPSIMSRLADDSPELLVRSGAPLLL